jgi:hypothetical protein
MKLEAAAMQVIPGPAGTSATDFNKLVFLASISAHSLIDIHPA